LRLAREHFVDRPGTGAAHAQHRKQLNAAAIARRRGLRAEMSEFLTPLRVEETDEFGGLWTLLAPLRYRQRSLGRVITVPAGFVTDFASVPRILGVYDLEGGKCNKAAVVHDWLYSMGSIAGGVDRKAADQVLREAMTRTNRPLTPWRARGRRTPLSRT
jgi:hypothetical protein